MESPLYRIDVFYDLDAGDRSALHRFLMQQFARVKTGHPADQSLKRQELEDILDSDGGFAILCHDHTRALAGAMVITPDLKSVAWASEEYFRAQYADEGDITLFFIAGLAAARAAPSQVLNGMIDRLTDIVAEAGGVAIADFADQERNHSLARHIAGRVATRYQSDWQALGSQTYHAFRPGRQVNPISWSAAHRLVSNRPIGPGSVRD